MLHTENCTTSHAPWIDKRTRVYTFIKPTGKGSGTGIPPRHGFIPKGVAAGGDQSSGKVPRKIWAYRQFLFRHRKRIADYSMYCPPLTERVSPVMNEASSAARNSTARAISSGLPMRPTGIEVRVLFLISSGISLVMSVSI